MNANDLNLPITVEKLRNILSKYKVVEASVFGSFARGDAGVTSDIDILVTYDADVSLFDHFDLKDELEKTSGRHVDVVSDRSLSRHIKPYIYKEKVAIL